MVCGEERVRTILHSDLNNFYASVELLKHPESKDKPVVVCGRVEDRHGIVLAKNQIAKNFGVKTGDVLWEAKRKCGGSIVSFTADHDSYLRVSNAVRGIYSRFTDHIENFGIDECWLDVTDSIKFFGSGLQIAEQIRQTVKKEIGITVSIGVSFNKVFAKLGSDMKKPDAVTLITKENYKNTVWKLPVEDLLFVGRATKTKLNSIGVKTIGDLATMDVKVLARMLGVWGKTLYEYANGYDQTPVNDKRVESDIKSIGNSLTDYKDLENFDEVKTLIMLLAESVAARLRRHNVGKAKTVKLTVTDNALMNFGKQAKLDYPTRSAIDIANCAYKIFETLYTWERPVRAIGVSVRDFTYDREQLGLLCDVEKKLKTEQLDRAVDLIRGKYGNQILQRATILQDEILSKKDVQGNYMMSSDDFTNIED